RVQSLELRAIGYARQLAAGRRGLPLRYALHLLVGLLIPLAILIGEAPLQAPVAAPPPAGVPFSDGSSDLVAPIAPLALGSDAAGDLPVAGSAFDAIEALPIAGLKPQMLQPQPPSATGTADSAHVCSGPGTNYDQIGELPAGTQIQVLAQANGWYQARGEGGRIIWIAAELLDLDPVAADFLPEASNIPAPPPAKVGLVLEEGLNLRDGPDTGYIGLTKLQASAQLDLLARYGDWFQVQSADGQAGWVLGQYLQIAPGVAERVDVVTSIPDANPALIGRTSERNSNLRGGPGTAYEKIGALG